MAITLLSVLFLIINIAYSSHKNRKEEFSRITKYELIHVEPQPIDHDDEGTVIEFSAFNQDYKVELRRNNDMIATKIRHANIDPTTHTHQYFSSMTLSCHYHGRVVNSDASSVVALSLCPKRGIRGRITAFNETLIIYPSAYYLDLETDKKCDYRLSDELIVYRLSDFNASHIQRNDIDLMKTMPAQSAHNWMNKKRRLYTASDPAYTEMLMISGPVRTRNYKEDYAEQWYQQLLADLTEMVNGVSAIYKATDFGSNVGGENSIAVVFKELEVIEAFDGIYKSLKPNKLYSNCELGDDEYDDTDLCAINGQSWLGTIQNWIYKNKDVSTFDHAQFMSDMRFKWSKSGRSTSRTLGWGGVGVLCRGSSSASDVSVVPDMGGNTAAVRTMAHELGHNYGMEHDGQPGEGAACAADAGLMGYSDGEGFSTCSIASMRRYFERSDGLTCIGKGWRGVRTENRFDNADIGVPITTAPTTQQPTTSPTKTGETLTPSAQPSIAPTKAPIVPSGCIRIAGISDYLYDGVWMESNDLYYGKPTYYFTNSYNGNTNYLYFRDDLSLSGGSAVPSWYIGSQVGALSVGVYCPQKHILSCSAQFRRYTNDGWAVLPASTVGADCSLSPTKSPTKSPVSPPTQIPTINFNATPTPTQSPTKSTTANPTHGTSSPTTFPSHAPVVAPTPTPKPTAAPVVASGCVHIDGIDDTFYNGVWIEADEFYNNKPYYVFRNEYGDDTYLYFRNDLQISGGSATATWFIASTVGSLSINAYCSEEDLLSCSGKFRRFMRGEWNPVASSTIDTNCTSTPTCNKHQCLFTTGIPGYNGRWNPSGCINNEAYYQLTVGDRADKYICFSNVPNVKRWIITSSLCSAYGDDLKALTLQQTGDILEGGGWFISDNEGSFTQSLGAAISECNGNGAFHFDDLSCLDTNDIENVCVYSNNTALWDGGRTFESGTMCRNGQRVYLYVAYNESRLSAAAAEDNGLKSVESVYYLFFHQQLKYSDSNETVGQWLISKNDLSINSIALCEKDDLLECRESSWKVQTTRFDDSVFDNLLVRSIDKYLTVNNGECGVDEHETTSSRNWWENPDVTHNVICMVGGIIVIVIICVLCQKRSNNKKLSRLIGKSIGNENDLNADEEVVYLRMDET